MSGKIIYAHSFFSSAHLHLNSPFTHVCLTLPLTLLYIIQSKAQKLTRVHMRRKRMCENQFSYYQPMRKNKNVSMIGSERYPKNESARFLQKAEILF